MLAATAIAAIAFNCIALAEAIQNEAYRMMPGPVRISCMALALRCFAWLLISGGFGCLFSGVKGFVRFAILGAIGSPIIALLYLNFT